MKAFRRIACVAAATLVAVSSLSTSAQARQRAAADEGGIAGSGIPLMTTTLTAVGLIRPVFVTYAPGDPTRLFVLEKRGVIRIIKINVNPPSLLGTAFLNIDPLVTGGASEFDEQGLLGMAFHPNYAQNGYYYVYYTGAGTNFIARYQVSANPDISNTTASIIFQFSDNQTNHNGGWLGFKPGDTQGYLHFANGDGGGSCDSGTQHVTGGNGQSIDSHFGKILRIDIDGADNIVGNGDDDGFPADATKNYAIPPSNPFASGAGLDEVWDFGLRNPFRCSFDRANGDLYIGDVGQFQREEVNYEPSNSPGGNNYGWRCMEGTAASSISTCSVANCTQTTCGGPLAFICPVTEYTHAVGCAITGGYVYRGSRMPQLQGTYFYADYAGSCGTPNVSAPIFSFKIVGGVATNQTDRTTELAPSGGLMISGITTFGEDYFGEVYICDQEGGEIFKIVPRPCLADIVPNGERDVLDLLAVINAWGPCPGPCPPCAADVATPTDCQVTVLDLLAVINNWGTCP